MLVYFCIDTNKVRAIQLSAKVNCIIILNGGNNT